jgi:adenylate cyclase, class 2
VIFQRDTYFGSCRGILKLREETPGRPHLIQYERAKVPAAKESSWRTVEVDDAEAVREVLGAALGIWGVVEKRRHLFLWRGVRIHLDDVRGLGRFIELEAVAPPGSDLAAAHELVAELIAAFKITDQLLCASRYGALLADRAAGAS